MFVLCRGKGLLFYLEGLEIYIRREKKKNLHKLNKLKFCAGNTCCVPLINSAVSS